MPSKTSSKETTQAKKEIIMELHSQNRKRLLAIVALGLLLSAGLVLHFSGFLKKPVQTAAPAADIITTGQSIS